MDRLEAYTIVADTIEDCMEGFWDDTEAFEKLAAFQAILNNAIATKEVK